MRPGFFSKYEWWYHLSMMPIFFVAGNYYFIGDSYFSDFKTFFIATQLVFVLYWFSIIVLTLVIRWVIARFPHFSQNAIRLVVMLVLVGSITMLLAVFDVWAYSIFSYLKVEFVWDKIWPIMILGIFFDFFLCAALGLFYAFEKWKQNQTESEKLERIALQQQFDTLKGQVNPHFLFNSLNTLSSLIGEDKVMAEQFVEDLSRIYRYMLQAAKVEYACFSTEIEFLETYARLLKVRYGDGLQFNFPSINQHSGIILSPLSFQNLVDNAIKHNMMSVSKPLIISIDILPDRRIRIKNNLQRKIRTIDTQEALLSNLVAKYTFLCNDPVEVVEHDNHFTVILPIIKERELSSL
ncbi:sensor histidine kinase [Emticicia agri]|uniref:Histidine kinase n=1 Tax=Emticicia agri TaxID=2492393 RepID=A0A4Q5LVQ0_9BACT|nr:sensor histidine kinase [Emticicia agri]RYU93543.1 histidine kinase [Emticicia agri]